MTNQAKIIKTNRHGLLLEIVIENPPVNALSEPVRREIYQAVQAAQTDATIGSLVIRGGGRMFSAGADVIDLIESSIKPVVIAIHGSALGGGLEIALGAHYRRAGATISHKTPCGIFRKLIN